MQNTQVVLVSQQTIPNITPILDERSKPDKVILVVTRDMQDIAENLKTLYQPRGVRSEFFALDNAWDIAIIRDQMLGLLAAHENENLVLNATGGTKPMSIAAYEVFRLFNKDIFYVHPEKDRLIWMHPGDRVDMDLADRIKLPAFLQSHGAILQSQGQKTGVRQQWRSLTEDIINKVHYYEKALGTLNFLAARAESRLRVDFERRYVKDRALMELVDQFAGQDLLKLDKGILRFTDEQARFYVNGGWLEEHVYGVCIALKKQADLQDVGRSLEVQRKVGQDSVLNELDVVFLKDNRLYLIECKTSKFTDRGGEDSKGAETLYKLDTLKDIMGGIQAGAMLASYRQLPDYDLNRARDLGIKTCCHKELINFKQHVLNWINRP